MKVLLCVTLFYPLPFFCEAQNVTSQSAQTVVSASTSYAITDQDANSRIWQNTTYDTGPGGVNTNTHSYTELCSGLNHLVNGQWVESSEQIDILPNGTAVATNGQHQAYFPGDIYQGQIELVTPDGLQLNSRPMGLSYFDGTNSVLIAELTNSIGVVVGNNQVIYPNVFTDFKADLRYTYTKSGFEQDIILRTQPPTPESLGLDPDTTRLQILTEFFSPPQPTIQSSTLPTQAGLSLTDESLGFGTMQMMPGRAFLLGQNAQDTGALVDKQWLLLNGRQFLVEEVPVDAILEGLAALPLTAMNSSSGSHSHTASKTLTLPAKRMAKIDASKKLMLAEVDPPTQGFVLDYQTTIGSLTNYTFRGDTTYYISGALNLYQTNTFDGNTVLKFATNGTITILSGSAQKIIWNGASYRPVIFTAKDDNTVGDSVGSGTPSGFYGSPMLSFPGSFPTPTISGWRVSYAQTAIQGLSVGANIYNAQFVNCQNGLSFGGAAVFVGNALFANTVTNFILPSYSGGTINVQNTTFSGSKYLVSAPSSDDGYSVALTNCILANVTNLQAGVIHTTNGNYNGLYSTAYRSWLGPNIFVSSPYPFQTAGAGNYYLTNGCNFFNQGTTNLDPTLLAGLKQQTTYPPVLYSNVQVSINTTLNPQAQRDTDTPDLGYHYDPIDYLVDQFDITNALLTLANGVAIAGYNDTDLWLQDGSSIVSLGSPLYPNWLVRYSSVQEEPVSLGPLSPSAAVMVNPYDVTTLQPPGVFRFTKFACPAGGGTHIYDYQSSWSFTNLLVRDCEFWGGGSFFGGNTNTVAVLENNLFWRSTFQASGSPVNSLSVSNNLFYGIATTATTAIKLGQPSGGVWYAFNNVFDTCLISAQAVSSTCTNGYNAYINSTNRLNPNSAFDIVTNTVVYQTGPFGTFYQPNTSPLINMGSTNANLVGLYHYTVITNLASGLEIKETNSIVDIGYHYVATDSSGNPIDTNGDGIPDYLEDANGNGLVDSGEIGWNIFGDFGLKVLITRPRNGSILP